jgi:ring-1,2-phenylacetyl-CoA epoxidase subunit PaaC
VTRPTIERDRASGTDAHIVELLLRLGDDRLVLGHRLSEWCGHAPILEEDIALANIALDFVGQAKLFLELAGELEGAGRSADDLAFFRDAIDFRNVLLVEQPNGDYGQTIVRQFLFDAFSVELMERLAGSEHAGLGAVAAKVLKEDRYHLRHSRQWVLRLGDGTAESHVRAQRAADELWTYTRELFEMDDLDRRLVSYGIATDLAAVEARWRKTVTSTFEEATLTLPSDDQYMHTGGRRGRHSEHLGHMLAVMQVLPRSHPDATW